MSNNFDLPHDLKYGRIIEQSKVVRKPWYMFWVKGERIGRYRYIRKYFKAITILVEDNCVYDIVELS